MIYRKMMPIKIKRSQKRLIALTFVERAKPIFFRLLKKFMKDEVLKSIRAGRSPVAKGGDNPPNSGGKLRYKEYSDGYLKAIKKGRVPNKKKSPRNLTVTGKMLNSIKARPKRNSFKLWFTDPKAKYHNKLGAGKSKVIRRMLPNGDKEDFNAGIKKRIANALLNAIKLSKK